LTGLSKRPYNTDIDSKEQTMWVVKRCVRDYEDVIRTEVAEFDTEQSAWDYADRADDSHPWEDVWHEVEEE
jgi:hypothetical protein